MSHLRFHKFKHSFQDTLNPICKCGTVETAIHYLIHSIDENILSKGDSSISKVLLFGDNSFNDVRNTSVLTASIKFIISAKC